MELRAEHSKLDSALTIAAKSYARLFAHSKELESTLEAERGKLASLRAFVASQEHEIADTFPESPRRARFVAALEASK